MASLSDDRLVREIKRFLSTPAQNYINMVQRTGKPTSILQQFEGLTTDQIRFLNRLMSNPSAFSGMNILEAGVTKNDNPELLEGLNEVVAKGGEIPEPKRPYYNPVTSSVEMLTVEEALRLNYREATEQEKQVAGVSEPRFDSSGITIRQIEFGAGPAPASDPNQPPVGPLPPGQQYVYDATAKAWSIVDSGGNRVGYVEPSGALISGTEATAAPARTPSEEGGVSDVAEQPADTGIPVDWEQAAAEMYPEYYAIVKSVPEVAALLKKSLGPPAWSDEKLEAELRKTNWWKTTVASAREWDMASGLDPATYQGRVDEQAAAINQQALDLGIRLSDERLQKLATDSLRLGWSGQTITNSIGMAASEGGAAGTTQLREGYYGQSIREISQQYGVSLADQTFNQFVDKIAVGEETLGSFQDYALSIAKSLYPSLAEQFDAGRTFNQATDNYKQIAANILERDPNSINMTDPTWVQAVTYQPDPKTGEQRMMNMAEWGDYLRKNEALGYQYTTEARSRAYEVADKLANMFGRV